MQLPAFFETSNELTIWLMLAFIAAAFLPYVLYLLAVCTANLRGRPVPSFGDTMSTFWPLRGSRGSQARLDEIASNTREILTILREHYGVEPASERTEADAEDRSEKTDRRQDRRSEAAEDDGMGRSTAWADRRRSDRGKEARGTGYSGAEPGRTYKPGTGTRSSDRPSMPEDLRSALRRLKLADTALPDVASLTRAYRDSAKANHPDKGGATDSFVAIKEAYDRVLKEIGAVRSSAH